jgi:hypothetical protein
MLTKTLFTEYLAKKQYNVRTQVKLLSQRTQKLGPMLGAMEVFMSVFSFVVSGMEPRALHKLAKCSTTERHPQSLALFRQAVTVYLMLVLNL